MSNDTQENNSEAPLANETIEPTESPLKVELEKAKNDYLYLKAEFENYKRQSIKERSDLLKFGGERLVVDLLGALDNFERALSFSVTAETFPTFVQGIQMTHKELVQVLQKHGVQELPALNEAFNPLHHEALTFEETADFKEGTVSKVFRKPYKMHDKTIRVGQVVVAKTPQG